MHDYVMFNSKIMGFQIQNAWNAFETDRIELIQHCNVFFILLKKKFKITVVDQSI